MPELSCLQGAARIYWMQVFGTDVPFYDQASLGGEDLFRGFQEDRFIDMGAWEVEAEQRVKLFRTHLFGVVADWRIDPFVSVGQVYGDGHDALVVRARLGGIRSACLDSSRHPRPRRFGLRRRGGEGLRDARVSLLMQRPPISRKYRAVALGGLFGLALLISLAARSRTAEVLTILRTGGGWALMAASLYRIVPVELNAAAWAALLEKRPLGWAATLWMRWIGEAVNSLLPAAQIGGDFARARLLTAGGVPAAEATAAMVADVAVGAFTQVLFTFVGAAALILGAPSEAPARAHLGWLALVIGIGAGFAALLIVVARVGVGRLLTALPLHLNGRFATRLRIGGAAIDRSLGSIRRRPRALLVSATWHLLAWLSQVFETWLVLRLLGRPIGWVAALAMESLAASARGAAFVVPGGIGVQEGALVAVGAAFGVPAPAALALAVVKRARELVVGAPAIVAWVIAERHSIATFWSRRYHEGETPGGTRSHLAEPAGHAPHAAPPRRRARRPLLEPDGGRSRQDLGAAGGDSVRGGRGTSI